MARDAVGAPLEPETQRLAARITAIMAELGLRPDIVALRLSDTAIFVVDLTCASDRALLEEEAA